MSPIADMSLEMTNASRGRLARFVGNRAMPRPVPSRQRGQAMVFSLAFGVATTLVALVLFNSGILANTKTRLQNAADAGAYSAAVLQARDHNFSALTNRAMVANQAAVAQIVSMKSFLEDAVETQDRMGEWLLRFQAEFFPSEKPDWDRGLNHPIGSIASTFNSAAPTLTASIDRLIRGYETAQEGHHEATAAAMIAVANEVVRRNDPQAEVTSSTFRVGRTNVQVLSWRDYTRRHAANNDSAEADRFADVVVSERTTDPFTRARGPSGVPTVPLPKWGPTEVKWCKMLPNHHASTTTFAFIQAGGGMLSEDKKTWLALDSTMGAGAWSCTFSYPCWTGICYSTIGGLHLDFGGSGGGRAGNGEYTSMNGYRNNPSESNRFGNGAMTLPGYLRYIDGPGPTLDSNGGLQNYYRDVADTTTTPENQSAGLNASPAVTIEVERTGATVRTSSAFLTGSDRLGLEDEMQGDTMRVLSSAQSYFYRPRQNSGAFTRNSWQRGDNRAEMANLYSPYWQTRLVERSLADRAASWGAQ